MAKNPDRFCLESNRDWPHQTAEPLTAVPVTSLVSNPEQGCPTGTGDKDWVFGNVAVSSDERAEVCAKFEPALLSVRKVHSGKQKPHTTAVHSRTERKKEAGESFGIRRVTG